MATVLSVSGSPSASSRTNRLLRHLDQRLTAQGHEVIPLDVRTLPAEALLGADFRHPAVVEAAELFARADGVVVGTPVYKASYSGVLKALLDLLPQYALTGKTACCSTSSPAARAMSSAPTVTSSTRTPVTAEPTNSSGS
ncbi:hypothetical protein SHIRM173S_05264 [Streptomyces hirsutus]